MEASPSRKPARPRRAPAGETETETETEIVALLRTQGPCRASTLIDALVATGVARPTATKRIQRASNLVRKLSSVRFQRNDTLHYLDEHRGNALLDAIIQNADVSGSKIGAGLALLRELGGVIPAWRRSVIFPVRSVRSGRATADQVFDRLWSENVLRSVESGKESVIAFGPMFRDDEISAKRLRARLLAEGAALGAVHEWARRNCFGSYEAFRVRSATVDPVVAGHGWDITAPSYLWPLVSSVEGKLKPGFFVCDIHLVPELSEVRPFLAKCDDIRGNSKNRPLFPMIVAPRFAPEAYNELRARGIVATTPDILFGRGTGKALLRLADVLERAASAVATDPDAFIELFSKLSAIEGAAANLRGPLFEMIAAHLVREKTGGSIDIGKEISDPQNGSKAEIDVLCVRGRTSVVVIECKGHGPGVLVAEADVVDWLERQVPRIWRWIQDRDLRETMEIRFEFWTSGKFHDDARRRLTEAQARTRKYGLVFYDGDDIDCMLKETRNPHLRRVFREQYFAHPLASLPADHLIDLPTQSGSEA